MPEHLLSGSLLGLVAPLLISAEVLAITALMAVVGFTVVALCYKPTYFGSVLGYLWSLSRPLMFFGVLYLVFP